MKTSFKALLESVRAEIAEIDAETLNHRLNISPEGSPPLLLDVREHEELAKGQLPNALHLPRGSLELRAEALLGEDRSQEIVVYCAGGARSALAARSLKELGFERVLSLKGGLATWRHHGFEVIRAGSGLTPSQRARYARQLTLEEIGERGQQRLLRSRALVLGVGGLGSPAALYLAAAGVGTIGLVDHDRVEQSNLQRQILHADERIGQLKVDSGTRALRALNPETHVERFEQRLNEENIEAIFSQRWDVILDGTDNFATRYLVNAHAQLQRLTVVHGSVMRFHGQVTTLMPHRGGPCYRCLYPEAPPEGLAPSCQQAGVLGVMAGVIGTLQASEALKLLLKIGEPLKGRLLQVEALGMRFKEVLFERDPDCPDCAGSAQRSSRGSAEASGRTSAAAASNSARLEN